MIPRYSRPAMSRVFTDETRMGLWLAVEKAALAALVVEGIAPEEAFRAVEPLEEVDVAAVQAREAEIHHDLAAFVDVVGRSAPGAAGWLHWGLTSSDVVDTALALQLVQAGGIILDELARARTAVARLVHEHAGTVELGRTPGIAAKPITFGVKLAGWWHTLGRDEVRIAGALEAVRVGKLSGAVGVYSGVSMAVERRVLEALALERDPSATQVVQRDRHAQLLSALALCGANLERVATEVRHLQRSEVAVVHEPFGRGQKGSSAMPHKRNPIVAERICGLARVLRGHAQVALENVALWHERDISHSSAERVVLPDAFLALDYMLDRFTWLVEGLDVDVDRMRANLDAQRGLPSSQRVLLALVRAGADRDDAYRMVQGAALRVHGGEAPDLATALEADAAVVDLLGGAGEVRTLAATSVVPDAVSELVASVPSPS
jgi:adenylosuccinate lyase